MDQYEEPYIHYTRRIRGVFFEKMELFEFPRDVQDLSVTVMSELSSGKTHIKYVCPRCPLETLVAVSPWASLLFLA